MCTRKSNAVSIEINGNGNENNVKYLNEMPVKTYVTLILFWKKASFRIIFFLYFFVFDWKIGNIIALTTEERVKFCEIV